MSMGAPIARSCGTSSAALPRTPMDSGRRASRASTASWRACSSDSAFTVTAGLGGMGGAQPLAVTMNDGVAICIDVDQSRISRRIEHRYLDEPAGSLEDGLARALAGRGGRGAPVLGGLRDPGGGRARAVG